MTNPAGADTPDRARVTSNSTPRSAVLKFLDSPAVSADLRSLERRIKETVEEARSLMHQYAHARVHALLAGVEAPPSVDSPAFGEPEPEIDLGSAL